MASKCIKINNMKKILAIVLIYILTTLNVSAQWIQQTVPQNITIVNSINFTTGNIGIATGWEFDSQIPTSGRALYTTNAGANWNSGNVPNLCRVIVSTEYISPTILLGVGAINLVSDATNLDTQFSDFEVTGKFKRSHIKETKNKVLNIYRGAFFKSTDGGINWFEYGTLPSGCNYLTYMDFINANTGLVTADVGSPNTTQDNIYKTTDGGLTWSILLSQNINGQLESIQYLNENLAFATGYDQIEGTTKAVFLKTTNGGTNWTRQVNDSIGYKKAFFINNNTGFIAGGNSATARILKTTDQGNTWNNVYSKDSVIMGGVNFFGETGVGIAFGNRSIEGEPYIPHAFRTTNFGATWSVQIITTSSDPFLTSSFMLDKYNYFVSTAGFNPDCIFHTTNGGSVGVSYNTGSFPDKFSLEQNYPNPFNPSTSIKFNIPSRSQIILKVYAINGKEIATLINEVKSEGSYEVKFDAGNQPSGVYYYKLFSGNYSETKKMLLVK